MNSIIKFLRYIFIYWCNIWIHSFIASNIFEKQSKFDNLLDRLIHSRAVLNGENFKHMLQEDYTKLKGSKTPRFRLSFIARPA